MTTFLQAFSFNRYFELDSIVYERKKKKWLDLPSLLVSYIVG